MDKNTLLKQYFGHTKFREGQEKLIDSIMSNRDVLGIMPTGAGKSICFQVPALMLGGITLVISPLISLMKDQVRALVQSGIKAAYINSSLTWNQNAEVIRRANQNEYKIIYVAPERLLVDSFLEFAIQNKISMITIDEAHCVSQWGQDFRPSYLKIVQFIEHLPYRPIISAFTATATTKVREDIVSLLSQKNPLVLTTGFDRENLFFGVEIPKDKFDALMNILGRNKNNNGIVYCSTRKTVEEVCEKLIQNDFAATRYHAGLGDNERHRNQDDFQYDRKTIMVATNAFGMGIDKSNVSFVVHYDMPKNLESYYQEVGRAGRDGEPAECILLYAKKDVQLNKFLITHSSDKEQDVDDLTRQALIAKDLDLLKIMTFYCTTTDCLRHYILRYFGERTSHFCGNCSNCNTNFESVDITIQAQKIVSCVYRIEQRGNSYGKVMLTEVLRGSSNDRIVRFGLDKLPTYGIMADTPAIMLRKIIDFLIEYDYLDVTSDKFPVVGLGSRSNEIIREFKPVSMKLPKDKAAKPVAKAITDSSVDIGLLTELKMLRKMIASQDNVPAYIVFSDASLIDMCKKRPTTKRDFMYVSGVGVLKADKYSMRFTNLIESYMAGKLMQTHTNEQNEHIDACDAISYRDKVISEGKTNAYQSWTTDEDTKLTSEYREGLPVEEIGKVHNRTSGAIRSRLLKLSIIEEDNQNSTSLNTDKPNFSKKTWTLEERAQVIDEYKNGMSISDIAIKHERSEKSISYKLMGLGILKI